MSSPTKEITAGLASTTFNPTIESTAASTEPKVTIPPGHAPVTNHPQETGAEPPYAALGTSLMQVKRRALLEYIAEHRWTDVPKPFKKVVGPESDTQAKANALEAQFESVALNKETLKFTWGGGKVFDIGKAADAIALYEDYAPLAPAPTGKAKGTASTLELLQSQVGSHQAAPVAKNYKQVTQAIPDLLKLEELYADCGGTDSLYDKVLSGKTVTPAELASDADLAKAGEVVEQANRFLTRLSGVKTGMSKPVNVPIPAASTALAMLGTSGAGRMMNGFQIRKLAEAIRDTAAVWPSVRQCVLQHRETAQQLKQLGARFEELNHQCARKQFQGIDAGIKQLRDQLQQVEQRCRQTLDEIGGWDAPVQSSLWKLKSSQLRHLKTCYGQLAQLRGLRNDAYVEWKLRQPGGTGNLPSLVNELGIHADEAIEYAWKRVDCATQILENDLGRASDKKTLEAQVDNARTNASSACTGVYNTLCDIADALTTSGTASVDVMIRISCDMTKYADLAVERRGKPKNDDERSVMKKQVRTAAYAHKSAYKQFDLVCENLRTEASLAGKGKNESVEHIEKRIDILNQALAHIDKAIAHYELVKDVDIAGLANAIEKRMDTHYDLHTEHRKLGAGWLNRVGTAAAGKASTEEKEQILEHHGKAIKAARSHLQQAEAAHDALRDTGAVQSKTALEKKIGHVKCEAGTVANMIVLYHNIRHYYVREKLHAAESEQERSAILTQGADIAAEALRESNASIALTRKLFASYRDDNITRLYAEALKYDCDLIAERMLLFSARAKGSMPSWEASQWGYSMASDELFQRIDDTMENFDSYLVTVQLGSDVSQANREALLDYAARFGELADDLAWLQQACEGQLRGDKKRSKEMKSQFVDAHNDLARAANHIGMFLNLRSSLPASDGKEGSAGGQAEVIRTRFDGHVAGRMLGGNRFEAIDRNGGGIGAYVRGQDGWHKEIVDDEPVEQAIEQSAPEVKTKQIRNNTKRAERHKEKAGRLIEEGRSLAHLKRSPEAILKKFDKAEGCIEVAIRNTRRVIELAGTTPSAQAGAGNAPDTLEALQAQQQALRSEALELIIDTIKARTAGTRADGEAPVLKCFDLRYLIQHDEVENVHTWTEESKWRDRSDPTEFILDPETGEPLKTWIRKYTFDIKPGKDGPCGQFEAHFHYDTEQDALSRPETFRSGHLKRGEQWNFGVLARRAGIQIFRAELSDETRRALDGLV